MNFFPEDALDSFTENLIFMLGNLAFVKVELPA